MSIIRRIIEKESFVNPDKLRDCYLDDFKFIAK